MWWFCGVIWLTVMLLSLPQVFDVTRKITYKNLSNWYRELRQNRPDVPCILCANKIDGKWCVCVCVCVCVRVCNQLLPVYPTNEIAKDQYTLIEHSNILLKQSFGPAVTYQLNESGYTTVAACVCVCMFVNVCAYVIRI